jgi:tRNA modification GTPase
VHPADTIVAVSSAPGVAVRGILRITGPQALAYINPLLRQPLSGQAGTFTAQLRDVPLAITVLVFTAPHSFTGEDTIELHVPGSPVLLTQLQEVVQRAGARAAGPGEFSLRAFLHGKLDLTMAEGIAATIAASGNRELQAATVLRNGHFYQWLQQCTRQLTHLLALLEVGLDFADEPDMVFIAPEKLLLQVRELNDEIIGVQRRALDWQRLSRLPAVVLLGRANVGKSLLLNRLSASARALVSPVAGTTRDVLEAIVPTPNGPIRLLDVAGLEQQTQQELRSAMQSARNQALAQADVIMVLLDAADTPESVAELRQEITGYQHIPTLWVKNKIDLPEAGTDGVATPWAISAHTGAGIPSLIHHLGTCAYHREALAGQVFVLNARHRELLAATCDSLQRLLAMPAAQLTSHPELAAAELRLALDWLGQITGHTSPDSVLGHIFGQFCIGK